jgi:hypothetical protein
MRPPRFIGRGRSIFRAENRRFSRSEPGTIAPAKTFLKARANDNARRGQMPVLVMWAVPAVIVIGGVGYWLVHMH